MESNKYHVHVYKVVDKFEVEVDALSAITARKAALSYIKNGIINSEAGSVLSSEQVAEDCGYVAVSFQGGPVEDYEVLELDDSTEGL